MFYVINQLLLPFYIIFNFILILCFCPCFVLFPLFPLFTLFFVSFTSSRQHSCIPFPLHLNFSSRLAPLLFSHYMIVFMLHKDSSRPHAVHMFTDAWQLSDEPEKCRCRTYSQWSTFKINCSPLLADSSSYPSSFSTTFLPVPSSSASFHTPIFLFLLLCISSTFPLVVLPLRSYHPLQILSERLPIRSCCYG